MNEETEEKLHKVDFDLHSLYTSRCRYHELMHDLRDML
jgi:hypothetical protein